MLNLWMNQIQMMRTNAKKQLGQHFLNNIALAQNIVDTFVAEVNASQIIEVGPGQGVLTQFLLKHQHLNTYAVELDTDLIPHLAKNYFSNSNKLINANVLHLKLADYAPENWAVIGNFPYNISSQIFFWILEQRNLVNHVVCMLQKEVAERICTQPGSRTYGILSVLLQAFYTPKYLFTVTPDNFNPPPKVQSAVIELKRNNVNSLNCNEKLFKTLIKTAFGQRRKMLRNSLANWDMDTNAVPEQFKTNRPEQLSVADFVLLTNLLDKTTN